MVVDGDRAWRWPWLVGAGLGGLVLSVIVVSAMAGLWPFATGTSEEVPPSSPVPDVQGDGPTPPSDGEELGHAEPGAHSDEPTPPPDIEEYDLADPTTVELPEIDEDEVAAVLGFLSSEGQILVDFHEASSTLLGIDLSDQQRGAERCEHLADELLEPLADPDELLSLARRLPDDDTINLVMNSIAGTKDFVATCSRGGGERAVQELRAEAYFFHVVLDRRFAEVGLDP